MIIIDTKNGIPQNVTGSNSAHLMSTLPGEAGTVELLSFAEEIGLNRSWIQHPGTAKEHFDVWGSKLEAALENNAKEVGMKGLGQALIKKRKAMT